MSPYVAMADQQPEKPRAVSKGATAKQSVTGAFFPWQIFGLTPYSSLWIVSYFTQLVASLVVSIKVSLLATEPHGCDWLLTVRMGPAKALIAAYGLMAIYTLLFTAWFWNKSTGLRWDPISLVDDVALFAKGDCLEYFEEFELQHGSSATLKKPPPSQFRIGYWEVRRSKSDQTNIVYAVGSTETGEHAQLSHKYSAIVLSIADFGEITAAPVEPSYNPHVVPGTSGSATTSNNSDDHVARPEPVDLQQGGDEDDSRPWIHNVPAYIEAFDVADEQSANPILNCTSPAIVPRLVNAIIIHIEPAQALLAGSWHSGHS